MRFLQKKSGANKVCAQLAESVMSQVHPSGSKSHMVVVIFDVYMGCVNKKADSYNRGTSTNYQYKNIAGGHKCRPGPQDVELKQTM